jgi:hypothetical protein
MRMMNLPVLSQTSDDLGEHVALLRARSGGVMPHPELSLVLVAYMAWPEEEVCRDEWMSLNLTKSLAGGLSADDGEDRTLAALQKFDWLNALTRAAEPTVFDRLEAVQRQWPHVAELFQYLVDMSCDDRVKVRGGASLIKALELTQLNRLAPVQTVFDTSWRRFRHIAHIIAASGWLSLEAFDGGPEAANLTSVLFVPEAVIRLAVAYQQFGLTNFGHGQRRPFLDPDSLWRIPDLHAPLPLPFRRLLATQISLLNERRAPPKNGRPPQVKSE